MTPKQLATELNTDARTCRKFLRSISIDHAGKGGRWIINANDLPRLRILFAEYSARRTTTLTLPDQP